MTASSYGLVANVERRKLAFELIARSPPLVQSLLNTVCIREAVGFKSPILEGNG